VALMNRTLAPSGIWLALAPEVLTVNCYRVPVRWWCMQREATSGVETESESESETKEKTVRTCFFLAPQLCRRAHTQRKR
jgi:hypothetical protein